MYLLQLKDINKTYELKMGIFKRNKGIHALRDVSFCMNENSCLGIVGESGSGKSTLGKVILGLEVPEKGEIIFEGKSINNLNSAGIRKIRKDINAVFQDCHGSVNPRFTVKDIIGEPLKNHLKLSYDEEKKQIYNLLETVGLKSEHINKYPHELSGGQIQRVCIARAISLKPKLIIMDEAVSALDVSIQAQILNLMKDLQNEFKLSYIFISHDIEVVNYICDEIMFMKDGRTVELVKDIKNASHPYSKKLLSSVLPSHPRNRRNFGDILEGFNSQKEMDLNLDRKKESFSYGI